MTSILTNTGAVSAVDHLRAITMARTDKQQEVATGLRVKDAKDNSAYWSIATIMKSDTRALSAARDGLDFGAASADTATLGMRMAIDIVDEIKKKLLNSLERGVSHKKVNDELTELREELRTLAESSSFNGVNWLIRRSAADDAGPEVVSGFGRSADGTVAVQTLVFERQTDYGTNLGKMSVVRSVATLAYDCRRTDKFQGELMDALRIIDRGDMASADMRGDWAGEIGQTQFLPSSYMKYAVSYSGRGKPNLISNKADVLASTANYLAQHGWQRGQGWGPGEPNFAVRYSSRVTPSRGTQGLRKNGRQLTWTGTSLASASASSMRFLPM